MKYSNYFALIFKEKGIPNLSVKEHIRLFNIVHTEGVLKGMPKGDSLQRFRVEKQLTELTGNLKPEKLLEEMLRFSSVD